ncbi:hypothetical protein WDV06_05440 [Streptomyces racemochromogenes]|uniref:Integral membrane protein n=1 Tax=Streptomyces racemochromogenes TaxID=67353 RepID=A0ABW7P885_9ACTN
MSVRLRGRRPGRERPARPRPPVTRLRLACLFGGVFLLAGTVLCAVGLLLARQAVTEGSASVLDLWSAGPVVLGPADCPVPADGGPSPCPAADLRLPDDPLVSSAPLVLAALVPPSAAAGYVTAGYALAPLRRIALGAAAAGRDGRGPAEVRRAWSAGTCRRG